MTMVWRSMPTMIAPAAFDIPDALRWLLALMAAGVFASGVRDLYAALGMPHGGWPWAGTAA